MGQKGRMTSAREQRRGDIFIHPVLEVFDSLGLGVHASASYCGKRDGEEDGKDGVSCALSKKDHLI